MSEQFMIEMSSEEAKMWRRVAELTGQTVENLLMRRIAPILPNESLDAQIENVSIYSDEQLWAIVEKQVLSAEELAEREPILQRSKQGIHSDEDEKYLNAFSELYNKRVLLRTEALVSLQERGYDVKSYLKQNAPK